MWCKEEYVMSMSASFDSDTETEAIIQPLLPVYWGSNITKVMYKLFRLLLVDAKNTNLPQLNHINTAQECCVCRQPG